MITPMDVRPLVSAAGSGSAAPPRRAVLGAVAQPEDLSLSVVAAQAGDEQAFRRVYREVQPGLLRYLSALVGEDAEDVASEAWLQVARDFATFQGGGDDFRAWSARIARNRALDHLRARSRRPHTSTPIEALADRADVADTAGGALEMVATTAAIRLIAGLPRDQAEAVLLRVVIGLDAQRAGRVLGKRSGAVRTSTYRGLRRLGEILSQRQPSASGASDGGRPTNSRREDQG
jgi:RNA polymerase sigma-70 factor (ECF subfamily)